MEQRIEIDEDLMVYYHKIGVDISNAEQVTKAPPPLKIAYKAVKFIHGTVPDMSNEELMEEFVKIQNASHISDTQKKS